MHLYMDLNLKMYLLPCVMEDVALLTGINCLSIQNIFIMRGNG